MLQGETAAILPILLATHSPKRVLESINQGFNGPSFGPMALLFLAFTFVLVSIVTVILYRRQREEARERLNSPRALLVELAEAHELLPEQRKLLKDLAKAGQCDRADRLFVRPDLFEHGAGHARFASTTMQQQVDALRAVLFAESSAPDLEAPGV